MSKVRRRSSFAGGRLNCSFITPTNSPNLPLSNTDHLNDEINDLISSAIHFSVKKVCDKSSMLIIDELDQKVKRCLENSPLKMLMKRKLNHNFQKNAKSNPLNEKMTESISVGLKEKESLEKEIAEWESLSTRLSKHSALPSILNSHTDNHQFKSKRVISDDSNTYNFSEFDTLDKELETIQERNSRMDKYIEQKSHQIANYLHTVDNNLLAQISKLKMDVFGPPLDARVLMAEL